MGLLETSDANKDCEESIMSASDKGFSQSKGMLVSAWDLLKITGREWWNDNTFRLAASLAFYTMFSMAPVLLIATGVGSLFLARETAVEGIVSEVQRLAGAQGAQAVRQVLNASSGFGQGMWAIATGVVTFLLGASVVFAELQNALNQIWDVRADPKRGVLWKYLLDRARSFTSRSSWDFCCSSRS